MQKLLPSDCINEENQGHKNVKMKAELKKSYFVRLKKL
jgi:hypothetical protein